MMVLNKTIRFPHNMIEHSHLRIVQALHICGTLTEAASSLCLSQSALSHQIRYLEKKLAVTLWQREGRRLRLTQAGELLLETAQQVLPVLAQAEKTLRAYGEGREGILRIGVECYPCYQWLSGVIGDFLQQLPRIEIDIVNKFQFSGLEGLQNHHIDILLTPDPVKKDKISFLPLAEYEVFLLVAADHPLAKLKHISPGDLAQETLLTFPVPVERLDLMTQFLNPASVQPARIKEIESLDLMLQMVSFRRGVCALPEWLALANCSGKKLKMIRISKPGMHKSLFLAIRTQDLKIPYIEQFVTIGRKTAQQSFRGSS
jgi:LysR family transcriptional regulator for metE and metH